MTVPARIRANLGARQIDGDDVLATLQVPVLEQPERFNRELAALTRRVSS